MVLRKIFKKQIQKEEERVKVVPSCDLPSEALQRLRVLTSKLPAQPFAGIVAGGGVSKDFYTMRDVQGKREIVAFPLFFDGAVRIERAIMERGATIERHYHSDEMQHVILVRGKMSIHCERLNGEMLKKEIGSGESVYFPPNRTHWVEAMEHSYYINVNIPLAVKPEQEEDFNDNV